MVSKIIPYTTTVDKWSAILPPIGITVGTITVLSNVTKTLYDIPTIALAGYRCRGSEKMPEADRVKLANAYSLAKQNFWQHLTFIVIGILRIIPVVGPLLTWAYDSRQSNQLIKAGDAADKEKNYEMAETLYKKAVDMNGSAEAMVKIGQMYHENKIEVDEKENARLIGFNWIKRAADTGNARALNALGECHYSGKGTPVSHELAFACYQKGALKGDSLAQYNLADMHLALQVPGLPKVLDKAKEKEIHDTGINWAKKAADLKNDSAYCLLGETLLDGSYGQTKSVKEGIENLEKAIDLGNVPAMLALAEYYKELNTPASLEKMLGLYQKGAATGDAVAQNRLGVIYAGYRSKVDSLKTKTPAELDKLAIECYTKAAAGNHNWGHYNLAINYQLKNLGLKEPEKAQFHYEEAARLGLPEAEIALALLFSMGEGKVNGKVEPKNSGVAKQKAVELLKKVLANSKAGKDAINMAKFNLGLFTEQGYGVTKSYKAARKLIQEAADSGFDPAKEKIAEMDKLVQRVKRFVLCRS